MTVRDEQAQRSELFPEEHSSIPAEWVMAMMQRMVEMTVSRLQQQQQQTPRAVAGDQQGSPEASAATPSCASTPNPTHSLPTNSTLALSDLHRSMSEGRIDWGTLPLFATEPLKWTNGFSRSRISCSRMAWLRSAGSFGYAKPEATSCTADAHAIGGPDIP